MKQRSKDYLTDTQPFVSCLGNNENFNLLITEEFMVKTVNTRVVPVIKLFNFL